VAGRLASTIAASSSGCGIAVGGANVDVGAVVAVGGCEI